MNGPEFFISRVLGVVYFVLHFHFRKPNMSELLTKIGKFTFGGGMVIAAAQYLRVSTEHQHYSLQHQCNAIQKYAKECGFEIVQTYCDAGRSGLSLRNRPELTRLLHDVIQTNRGYSFVLVYDVSRWGRFQDCDEAAHYEFICKHAGAPVHYCAEDFTNDNSLPDSLLKALKRSMAAEYSREMSTRCFAAAQRSVQLGFKQGGRPGYGLRRLMISADKSRKRILERGEIKNVRTDRVILVPGPAEEVACVTEIYRLAVEENHSPYHIARELNRRQIPCPEGKWRLGLVCRILSDPKYAGHNVWNRTTCRLGQPRVAVPRSEWVMRNEVFECVITPALFCDAQRVLAEQRRPFTNEELLESLRILFRAHGSLSYRAVKDRLDLASITTFIKRFGTLRRAFELAGHTYEWTAIGRKYEKQTRCLQERLLREIEEKFPNQVSVLRTGTEPAHLLRIDKSLNVSVFVCPVLRRGGSLTWVADGPGIDRNDVALVARLNSDNSDFLDFYVLPRAPRHWIRHRGELKQGKRLASLRDFCSVIGLITACKSSANSCQPEKLASRQPCDQKRSVSS